MKQKQLQTKKIFAHNQRRLEPLKPFEAKKSFLNTPTQRRGKKGAKVAENKTKSLIYSYQGSHTNNGTKEEKGKIKFQKPTFHCGGKGMKNQRLRKKKKTAN